VRLIAPHRVAQGVYCQLPLAARDVALFMILRHAMRRLEVLSVNNLFI